MNWLANLLAAIFPRVCVNCRSEGQLLCQTCRLNWQHDPPESVGQHLAVYAYANPIVRLLITTWKYGYDQSAFTFLSAEAESYLSTLRSAVAEQGIEAIVPLPLSAKRLRERGFNQSDVIAKWLSEQLHLPVLNLLERAHRRGHQAERSTEERREAMRNSPFHLKQTHTLPAKVLLVDDVWTTGATLTVAKEALEVSGKTKVTTFTLAQG